MSITLFYDGKCSACYYEMLAYSKLDKNNKLKFQDITKEDFDPSQFSITPEVINKEFHVLTDHGMKVGVPAFIEIWEQLNYKMLSWFVQLPIVFQLSKLGYSFFTVIRPYLPKKNRCSIEDL